MVFSESAETDLEGIGDYIALDNPGRALSFVVEIRGRCAQLAKFPNAFALVPRYERHGIRRMVHGNYLIFYRVGSESIEILRILSGAVDYESILFPADKPRA